MMGSPSPRMKLHPSILALVFPPPYYLYIVSDRSRNPTVKNGNVSPLNKYIIHIHAVLIPDYWKSSSEDFNLPFISSPPTCSHFSLPADDGAHGVGNDTAVLLLMDAWVIVLWWKGWKDEGSVVQYMPQARNSSDWLLLPIHPGQSGRGKTVCRTG